jgi:hypothetical protein
MCHRNWPHLRYFVNLARQKVEVLACWNLVKACTRHVQTHRKNRRVLQLLGTMQFECEFFDILFMTCFTKCKWEQMLPTALAYKKRPGKWKYAVHTRTQPAYRETWLQGCSSTREASAAVFVAASLCFASCTCKLHYFKKPWSPFSKIKVPHLAV